MSKRTYAGPIIERDIEWGIVQSYGSVARAWDCSLAVDSATGDLVLIEGMYDAAMKRIVAYNVSLDMPGAELRNGAWDAIAFHVTTKAVRSAKFAASAPTATREN